MRRSEGQSSRLFRVVRAMQGLWERHGKSMITSLGNSRVKHLAALREKSRDRNREGVFLAEGWKMFEEAPIGKLREVYCSESFFGALSKEEEQGGRSRMEGTARKLALCRERGIFTEVLSDEVFQKAADTKTPQGILFVMEQFSYSLEEMVDYSSDPGRMIDCGQDPGRTMGCSLDPGRKRDGAPLFLILEDIQDPGNLGTMIRTGEGAGVNGVIMGRGCVDIYNPKTIRATMGSLYRVPFVYVEKLSGAVEKLKERGITVYAAHLEGEKFFDRIDYPGGSAFLIGNEGNGLRRETADLADTYIRIPMEGKLESLNAAVAAALLLYQAAGAHSRSPQKGRKLK